MSAAQAAGTHCSPSPALVQQLNVVVVTWVCPRYSLGQPFALGQKNVPNLLFGADHGQLGTNLVPTLATNRTSPQIAGTTFSSPVPTDMSCQAH